MYQSLQLYYSYWCSVVPSSSSECFIRVASESWHTLCSPWYLLCFLYKMLQPPLYFLIPHFESALSLRSFGSFQCHCEIFFVLVLWHWLSHLTSLSLNFLICKMGIMTSMLGSSVSIKRVHTGNCLDGVLCARTLHCFELTLSINFTVPVIQTRHQLAFSVEGHYSCMWDSGPRDLLRYTCPSLPLYIKQP